MTRGWGEGWRRRRVCTKKVALACSLKNGWEIPVRSGREREFQGGQQRGEVQRKGMARATSRRWLRVAASDVSGTSAWAGGAEAGYRGPYTPCQGGWTLSCPGVVTKRPPRLRPGRGHPTTLVNTNGCRVYHFLPVGMQVSARGSVASGTGTAVLMMGVYY